MHGTLYLIPNTLGSSETQWTIPQNVASKAVTLRYFIVEDIRTARRYLKLLDKNINIDVLHFYILNKHTTADEVSDMLKPLLSGYDVGILSEAGCPAIADPGAQIVGMAHAKGIRVVPLTGPSSIILAFMSSGINLQNFAFNGYLPIKRDERIKSIKHYENRSRVEKQAQIFIETPYRNMTLLDDLLKLCNPTTTLTIARNITLPDEFIQTKTIKEWKLCPPDLNKKPTIFIIVNE
ncbi:MAG: SAM-dependent methyltransferase [Marinilabiliaceae bacterium]|nr:SAM-dependent methyltransferase [Marinilabiliaceae bacterium]